MKIRFACVVLCGFCVAAVAVAAEKSSVPDPYAEIIRLSRTLKEFERKTLGVDPGKFATKFPAGEPTAFWHFVVAEKLRIPHSYMEAPVRQLLSGQPGPETLGLYADKDVYVYGPALVGGEERVPKGLVERPKARQLEGILHEDFHAYRKLSIRLRSIEESFANAFSLFEADIVAEKLLGDTELTAKVDGERERQMTRALWVTVCREELSVLYASPLADEEKLKRRKPILARCTEKFGMEANNASIALLSTYSRHFLYAWYRLKKYGVARFVQTYVQMPAAKTEKEWLAEFEKRIVN